MAAKKEQLDPMVENMKNISEMFSEVLKIVDVSNVPNLDQMEGEAHRDLCKSAHQIFHDPNFNLIIKNLVYASVMLVTEKGWDQAAYSNGQMAINGIQLLRETIHRYANIYETKYSRQKEDFDPHRAFEPGQIR